MNESKYREAELLPNLDSAKLTADLLGSVTTPTFFLWGADDRFGGEHDARMVTGMMPESELVMMPDAGHLPWLDDPLSAAIRVREFLERAQVSGRVDLEPHTGAAR